MAVGQESDSDRLSPPADDNDIEPKEGWFGRWFPALKWVRSSPSKLRDAEEEFIGYCDTPCSRAWYVDIGTVVNGNPCRIWTRKFGSDKSNKAPLVMVHGMAAGVAFFALNVGDLAAERDVYAFDLPGFARSSRPQFSKKAEEVERHYVDAMEEWRKKVGLEKMNLLGHSFGGYLSAAYALRHPDRVRHLILVDPWGFLERPPDYESKRRIPWYFKALFHVFRHFNPLAVVRILGPWGERAITRVRPDISRKFRGMFPSEEENMRVVPGYMYHCNAQTPSGESAFHSLMSGFAWAKEPMFPRLSGLDPAVPVTALYGGDSWVTTIAQEEFEAVRGGEGRYTKVLAIPDAGHHVYSDQSEDFNEEVNAACDWSEENRAKKDNVVAAQSET